MHELLSFLHSIQPLSPALQDHLISIVREKQIKKKDFLLRAGHISRYLSFVKSGLLRCFYFRDDNEICSWFVQEGEISLSSESFFRQRESYESIQALEDSTLYCIEYKDLEYVYSQFPEFNKVMRLLLESYFIREVQQLYGLRRRQAAERYQWLLQHYRHFVLRVPAKYLASWLGISEVMLSRIKSQQHLLK